MFDFQLNKILLRLCAIHYLKCPVCLWTQLLVFLFCGRRYWASALANLFEISSLKHSMACILRSAENRDFLVILERKWLPFQNLPSRWWHRVLRSHSMWSLLDWVACGPMPERNYYSILNGHWAVSSIRTRISLVLVWCRCVSHLAVWAATCVSKQEVMASVTSAN